MKKKKKKKKKDIPQSCSPPRCWRCGLEGTAHRASHPVRSLPRCHRYQSWNQRDQREEDREESGERQGQKVTLKFLQVSHARMKHARAPIGKRKTQLRCNAGYMLSLLSIPPILVSCCCCSSSMSLLPLPIDCSCMGWP